jgi:hypothetical protein
MTQEEQYNFLDLETDVKERIFKRMNDDDAKDLHETVHQELDTHIMRMRSVDVSLCLQDYGFGKAIQTYAQDYALMDLEGKSPIEVERLLLFVCVRNTIEELDWVKEFEVWNP